MATYDPARLYALLMNTGLQQKDQPLYQVIHDLIAAAASINTQVNNVIASLAPSTTPVSPTSNINKLQMLDFSGLDVSDGNDSFIPGPQGAQGIQGQQGISGLDGENSEEYSFTVVQSNNIGAATASALTINNTSITPYLILQNPALSTAGVTVQASPTIQFRSNVWNTGSLANNTNDWFIASIPNSGNPTKGFLEFLSSLNGAASTIPMIIDSAGNLTVSTQLLAGSGGSSYGNSANIVSGSDVRWASSTRLQAPANGQLTINNTALSSGVGFDVTTDALLRVRTRAETGDASISALNIQTSGTEIDTSFVIAVPVTLGTVVMTAGTQRLIINPAGTLAVLTVTLPATPVNGQLAKVSFTQAITALTFNAPAGATVVAAPTSAAIDTTFRFIYVSASTSWFPAG
jgi:hypothetical protein